MERHLKIMLFLSSLYATGLCRRDKLPFRRHYDYIVVGAGSSGATVASRLSEHQLVRVLLLEAGGQPLPNTEIPYLVNTLQNTVQDWSYVIEPQKNACQGRDGKRTGWSRGKALGGSSSINYMMYVRGNKRDYDNWAALGCTGWGYKDVLPFFKKSEDNRIYVLQNNAYHGKGGNLTVSYANYETPLRRKFVQAGSYLGYKIVDYNGASQTGFAGLQATLRDGHRCSTEKAFLRVSRPNFDIITNAFVTKIQFDRKKRAHSVVFEWKSVTHTVKAVREIIVSAGVVNTPQLLMLSGIGPKEHLQKMGIPVVADLQGVGANLIDHPAVDVLIYHVKYPITLLNSRVVTDANFKLFANRGRGPLSVPGGLEDLAFVHTKYSDPKLDYPDIEIVMLSIGAQESDIQYKKEYENVNKEETLTLIPFLLRPKSRGFIKLRSRDPHVHPIIDPRYLTEEDDLKVLMEGIRIAHNLSTTPSFRNVGAKIFPTVTPGCKQYVPWSDDFVACLARTYTITFNHAVGTCKMGNPKDQYTVVDPELKVKGVTHLRIADASVFPSPVSGNTNAACIMVGEKMADIIKRQFTN